MCGFVMPPLPPLHGRARTAGLLRSTGITPLPRCFEPVLYPLAFVAFRGSPGCAMYLAPTVFSSGEEGFPSCSARPCRRAVADTPPEGTALTRLPSVPAAFTAMGPARPPGLAFRGYICVHSRYGPATRSPSQGWLLDRLTSFGFPLAVYRCYGASGSYPGGTDSR